jgi:hypothetical protein
MELSAEVRVSVRRYVEGFIHFYIKLALCGYWLSLERHRLSAFQPNKPLSVRLWADALTCVVLSFHKPYQVRAIGGLGR